MVISPELEAGEPAVNGGHSDAVSEPRGSADGTPIGRNAVGELPQAPIQVVLPEGLATADVQVDLSQSGQLGQLAKPPAPRAANVSKLNVRPSDSGAAENASVEVEVKVSVIGRETHFAPIVPTSLPARAADRSAVPASVNRAAPVRPAASDGDAGPNAEYPGIGVETGALRRVSQAGVQDEQFDPFEHMRAAQVGEAKADARPSADRPTVERAGGGPATVAETRESSGGQPPPGLPVSAVQQIADRIVTALDESTSVRPPSASGAAAANSATAARLKVLHIELQPAGLGVIEIRLSLKVNALEVRLDASRAETAALIGRDKDALAGMLRSVGYLIDAMTVQVAEPDRSGASGQQGSQGTQTPSQSMTQTQSGGSQADARSDRADRQPQGDHRSNPFERDEHASDQRSLRPADGAVYV
jgi:hypothetical protein